MKQFGSFFAPILIFLSVCVFFSPFFLHGKLPIPADTIVGLYHPFRDLYAADYPRGIPFKNFLITDPVRQQYPWRWLAVETEKTGSLPLWNPYTMAGTPLLATLQGAVFYPLNILLFFLPFSIGWSFLIFLQPVLAGVFLYLYLRNLAFHPLASILGAIAYMFSGFSIAWLEWGTVGHAALWLPLVLLSIDKIINSKSEARNPKQYRIPNDKNIKRFKFFDFENLDLFRISIFDIRIFWCLVFISSLVFSFFAGHLQTFFYLYIVSVVYFFARWWQLGRPAKVLILYVFLNSAFSILTFVQWYPTLQFILSSARSIDQVNWQQAGWFVPWQHLVQFVAPDFFGNPTTLNYWGVWNYAELVGYVGIFPLIMAVFALLYRRDKKTAFFGIILFVSLLFSLPTFLAKLPFLLDIPFLATSQPTRLLFLVDFSLAILAAAGFDVLMRHRDRKIVTPIVIVGITVLSLWLFVYVGNTFFSISLENIFTTKRNLYFPTAIFLSLIGISILLLFVKRKIVRQTLFLLLIVVTLFDLLRFAHKFIPFVEKQYLFPQTQTIEFLKKDQSLYRVMAKDSEIMPPNFTVMYGLQTLDGYDPLYLQRYGELLAAIGRGKPDISGPFGFNRIITPHNHESRLIDLLGVKYILSLSELQNEKLENVFSEGQTKIYKNKNVFPRAFFVKTIKPVENKQQAINNLFDETIDLHSTAIVEGWDKGSLKEFSSGEVEIVHYSPNKIVLSTNSQLSTLNSQLFLVVMDTYYPTWHAKVDGNETNIYLSDYNFRGVVVPGGKHTVIFSNSLL